MMDECKGDVYRANVGLYRTKTGFAQTIRLVKIKKLSCADDDCLIHDCVVDDLLEGKEAPINIQKIKHNKLYRLNYCNIGRDWETGYVDDYDFELVEVNE